MGFFEVSDISKVIKPTNLLAAFTTGVFFLYQQHYFSLLKVPFQRRRFSFSTCHYLNNGTNCFSKRKSLLVTIPFLIFGFFIYSAEFHQFQILSSRISGSGCKRQCYRVNNHT
jgi:hypothetical protein